METIRQVRESNLIQIVKRIPGITSADAINLQRIAHRLHQLDVAQCNYGLNDRQEKRVTTLEKQAQEIAARYNLTAYHQGDPRGWSLYLLTTEQATNDDYYPNGLGICPH